jgi:hypothetical protein
LVADPDFPYQVARQLRDELPRELDGDQAPRWTVEVVCDPVTAGRHDTGEILRALRARAAEHGWDYAVCVTDLPLRAGARPVLADASRRENAAVVSLPALGGGRPYRRTRLLVTDLIGELAGGGRRPLPRSTLARLLAPVHRLEPDIEAVDIRYGATPVRGRIGLLTGMVRGNRPWRLLRGMSSALAAALATSAYAMISSSVWQLSDTAGPARSIGLAVAAVAVMTAWLIVAHHLWETRRRMPEPGQALLYNVSTVLTLGIGVGVLYLVLFVVDLTAAVLLIDAHLLASALGHAAGLPSYLTLAWAATSMGVVAGAVGSTLETDAAVRQAAYGYREEQRRAERAAVERRERSGG